MKAAIKQLTHTQANIHTMKMNRGGPVSEFQSTLGDGSGIYLKASKDFEDARRVRPILWLLNGEPCDALVFYEGWEETKIADDKGKFSTKSRPVRFYQNQEIPEGISWKVSSFKGEKPKPQLPKHSVAMVAYDYKESSVKIIAIDKANFVMQIVAMLSDTDPATGKPNEGYVEDITSIDLVIRRVDDKTWTIQTQAPRGGLSYPKECMEALKHFEWSWEAFMNSEKMEDADGKITYADVCDAVAGLESGTKASKNTVDKRTTPATVSSASETKVVTLNPDWRKVKTPQNAELGSIPLETLKAHKKTLDDLAKSRNNPALQETALYIGIISGIDELSKAPTEENLDALPDVEF